MDAFLELNTAIPNLRNDGLEDPRKAFDEFVSERAICAEIEALIGRDASACRLQTAADGEEP